MKEENLLKKIYNTNIEIERQKQLENDITVLENKTDKRRYSLLGIAIAGILIHFIGCYANFAIAVAGAVISLIAAGFSFTLINPEENIRIMQQELKKRKENFNRLANTDVEPLLQLPASKENIQYQDSITTYDKKIAKFNKR